MMHTLSVMDQTGDREVAWSPDDAASVEAARAIFDAARRRAYLVYAAEPGEPARALHNFDPAVKTMVATPAIVGG